MSAQQFLKTNENKKPLRQNLLICIFCPFFLCASHLRPLKMENNKVFSIYEKYLTADNYTDAEDESDIEMSFGDDLLEDMVAKSKSRRSSVSPLNSTTQTKTTSVDETNLPVPQGDQGGIVKIAADLLKSCETNSIIPVQHRAKLSQMGEEKVLNFIVDLLDDLKNKKDNEPREYAKKRLEKCRNELATIRRLFEEEESRFSQELAITRETNFKDKFKMDATLKAKSNLEEIVSDIQKNTAILKEEIFKLSMCKEVGLTSMPLP